MPNEINPQEIEQPIVTETETTIEPIYKHKDGRIFTKSQFLSEGVTEDRINNGLSQGLITQIGDTEDPEQQFKHKDGRVFSVKDFTAQGVDKDRIANGLKLGLITPIEKKNQIESIQQYQEPTTGSQVGVSQSTTNIPQVDITEVDKTTEEEVPPTVQAGPLPIPEGYDAISKAMESFDLKNRKKSKMTTSKNVMGQDITTITEEPDEEAIAQSKKVDEELKGYGIDANELYNKVKDIPEEVYSIQVKRPDGAIYNKYSKENLTKMALDKPVSFDYAVNTFKNRFALKKAANKLTEEGTPTDGAYLSELYNSLNEATTFDEWENNQIKQQELINTYLPTMEERRAALNRAKDNAAMFITPNNLDVQKAYDQSPLKGKVDISQFSALEVMKLYEPQKYEQALKFINAPLTTETEPSASISFTGNGFEYGVGAPKETQESIDAKIGKETILKTLSDQGRQYAILDLQRQNEKLVDASNKVTDPSQLENIKTQYEDNKLRINAIKDDYKKDAERFPLTSDLKYETQVKDFLNQAGFNAAEYGVSRLGKGFENTYSSMNNVVTKLFGSDMENTINQMKGLGFKKREEADFYMPEAYQGNAPLFLTQFEKPLADKLNAITQGKDLKDLSKKQLDDMSNVLIENQNQIKTVTNPNGGKSKNFLSLATLYSNTGMLGDIASFALQAGALKGLGVSDAMASAIPMWTTTQADFYREGVEKGVQDPDGYADVHAIVMFLAGLVNPSLKIVKRAVGIDTKLGQMLSGISEKTWNDVVNKNSQLVGKIQNSISHTAKEATGMALTFGAGTSLAGDIINKEMYAQDITSGQMIDNAIESMKHILNSSAGLLSIGAISNFKGAPMTEKSALWQLADNKSLNLTRIDEALKAGKISEDQAASRKKVVEDVSDIVNKMPNKDVNGKLMTDEQRLDYFYNLLLKKKGEEDKSVLPKPQQDKVDYASKVADYSNNLILDPKTDEELNVRKEELKDALTTKFDENGKEIELPENKFIELAAELDAIVTHLDKKENEKKPTQTTEQILANEPGAETIEVIDEAEIMRQMKPITDGMADVERQFKNEGYDIDWDYDNETQILDKDGEMVEPEDLPENLRKLAGQYEYLTSNLGEFDQKSFLKSLNESRKIVETEAEVVNPPELPVEITYPNDAQIEKDIREKNFATFTYEDESQVPEQFRDRISSRGEINGKKFIKVTLPKSVADYELSKRNQPTALPEAPTAKVETVTQKAKAVPAKKRGRPKKEKEEKVFSIASINRVDAKRAYDHVYSLDVPTDANGIVMHWLSMGGKINPESFTEDVTGYRRSRGAAKKLMPSEARTSEFTDSKSKLTVDGAASDLWNELPDEVKEYVSTQDLADALIDNLGSYSKRIEVAKDFISQYDPEEAVRKFYEQEIEQNKDEYEAERTALDDWYNERVGEDFDLMLDDNFVNKLIKEYEQEYPEQIKGGVEEITQGEKGGGPEKISGGENVPEEKPKSIADKIRALKSEKGKAYESILGIPVAIWDGALELAAKTAETTEDIAKIIKAGIDHIKESDWYKNLSSTEKQKTEKDFSSKMKSLLGIEEPTKVTIETEHPFLYEGTDEKRVAGLMKNMLEAENVSDETKRLLKKGGVEYKTASNAEAEIIANDVIKSFGDKDALKIAEGKDMHPSVRSAIYAKLIDNAFKDEMNAKTEEAKLEAAQRQAELSIKYSKELTAGGQFTAYAGHFYRTSPLAFVFRENAEREKRASDWYSDKKETYQEIFERIKDIAEVKEAIAKEVESALKEERKARREKRDKNIDDFFNSAKMKGGVYSTIIPPKLWNTVMDGMNVAVKAGDRVVDIVQRAIDEISKSIGDSWDKEKFRKDFEKKIYDIADGGKKEKTEAETLEGFKKRKEELERRIRENDFSAEEYKSKKTLSEKEKAAKEEYEEVKKAYDEAKKNSPEWQDKKVKQFLERFKKKFPGLTEEQKRKVVIKSIKRIAESGSLSEAEFRDIVTEALGIKPLTDVDVKEIEGLVNKINAVTEAQQKMVKDPTEANIKAYEKAKEEGMKAALDLYTFVSPKSDIVRNLKSIITGSFLGVFSNILNIGSNIINQPLVRFPIAAIKQLSEGTLYGMSVLGNKFGLSNIYEPTSNLWEAQKGYFEGLGKGFKRGWFNFKTGTQEKDYFGKTTFYSNLNPKQAVKDIKGWWKGDQYYTKKELADRALRATIGWQPDFILKSMSFGDKPFRWAAEYAKARQIARMELKLKNENEVRAFLADPKEYSKKIFLERKDTEAIAEKKAQEIEDRVMDAGNKAVFEVDTILSWMSKKMDSWFTHEKDDATLNRYAKSMGAVLKAAQLPFIRIPAYIYWTTYKIINPELSLAQSIYHLSESAVYKKRGDEAKMRKSLEEAKDNLAMTAYGAGIAVAAASLVSGGYVRPSNDDETTAREAAGERTFGKSGVFNMGRMMGTKDWWVDLKWFGPLGGALNVRSKIYNARKKEALKDKEEDISFLDDKLDNLTEGAAEGLNNLIFNNAARTINALKSPQDAGKEWVTYNANTLQNVFTGATYAQLSKAMLPYQANTKADGTLEQINENAKTRNVLYRLAVGMPKAKVSIWGDPIKQSNTLTGIMGNVLGFDQGSPNQFGAIIFDDYQRTMNDKFFPMPEDYNITVNDEKVKLTEAEKYDLDEFIGKARKEMVGPFVYDLVATNAYNFETPGAKPKVYSELKDDEKVEALQWTYNAARDSGYLRFTNKYPKYKVADITPEKIIKQEFKEARKEIFGAEVIMKPPK
jgi:hypothetical protein